MDQSEGTSNLGLRQFKWNKPGGLDGLRGFGMI
jgi:hypothetical protein